MWERLRESSDTELAAIAGKALKEARYHQQHAADWAVRLGDGTDESRRRCEAALAAIWLYTPELFEDDTVDAAATAAGLGPAWSQLREPWLAEMGEVLGEAKLAAPPEATFPQQRQAWPAQRAHGLPAGRMQYLQRAYPRGAW
jgi:ring-1,2-phenylacetyl-CoA epoxidase subunit PaaC